MRPGTWSKLHSFSKRPGFALAEMLVVTAVFSITMLIATNVFVVSTKGQRQVAQTQRVQGDVRFALETVSREVRYGTIDYTCYAPNPSCDPTDLTGRIALIDLVVGVLPSSPGSTPLLALRDFDGNRVRFRVFQHPVSGEEKLFVCTINLATDVLTKCDTIANWESITPAGVKVIRGYFYLYPLANPYQQTGAMVGSPYVADDQPRVTTVLRTQQTADEVSPEQISTQTTVSSRSYAR